MKKKYGVIFGVLFLTILVCVAFLYGYGRIRNLDEVCILDSKDLLTDATLYRYLLPNDELECVDLTTEQIGMLLDQMKKITYRKIGSAAGMSQDENYATLNYTVDQAKIEIMFSSKNGGRMLVNVVSHNEKAPLYQMLPSGEAIQEMILHFFDVSLQLSEQ